MTLNSSPSSPAPLPGELRVRRRRGAGTGSHNIRPDEGEADEQQREDEQALDPEDHQGGPGLLLAPSPVEHRVAHHQPQEGDDRGDNPPPSIDAPSSSPYHGRMLPREDEEPSEHRGAPQADETEVTRIEGGEAARGIAGNLGEQPKLTAATRVVCEGGVDGGDAVPPMPEPIEYESLQTPS